MARFGPRDRSALLIAAVLATWAVAAETQNIQTLVPLVAGAYLVLAGGALWRASRSSGAPAIARRDLLVRRLGAWAFVGFVAFFTVLITQAYLRGGLAVAFLYVGGVLDQASLRVEGASA